MKLRLKEIRTAHLETQEQLAKVLGVKDSTVCCWETGVRSPSIYAVEKICQHYNCLPGELLQVERG